MNKELLKINLNRFSKNLFGHEINNNDLKYITQSLNINDIIFAIKTYCEIQTGVANMFNDLIEDLVYKTYNGKEYDC